MGKLTKVRRSAGVVARICVRRPGRLPRLPCGSLRNRKRRHERVQRTPSPRTPDSGNLGSTNITRDGAVGASRLLGQMEVSKWPGCGSAASARRSNATSAVPIMSCFWVPHLHHLHPLSWVAPFVRRRKNLLRATSLLLCTRTPRAAPSRSPVIFRLVHPTCRLYTGSDGLFHGLILHAPYLELG